MRSGVYSRNAFIEGESQQEFDSLKHALFEDLLPQTLVQCALAEDVLTQLWRKFRLERYASKKLKEITEREISITDLIADLGIRASDIASKAKRVTAAVRKNGVGYYAEILEKIQTAQQLYPKNCQDLAAFKTNYPELNILMRKLSWRPDQLDALIADNETDSSGTTFWEHTLKSLEDWAADWISCFDCDDKLNKSIPRIVNNRVYRHLISGDTDRAADDVSRALHRALAEYYKERDRYRKETAIVLDPEPEDLPEHEGSEEGSDADLVQADAA